MADLENFLCYWSDPNTKQDDVAFRLAHAYETTTARLTVLRHTTLDVLQPVKNSKGAWVPGFAPDAIDRAAALGTEIDKTDERQKSIAHDIEEYLELSGGKPRFTDVNNERRGLLDRISHTEQHAAAMLKKALDKDPHTSPAVLMQRADISEAYSAQEKAKKETEKPIAALNERIGKMRAILERYERDGSARGF